MHIQEVEFIITPKGDVSYEVRGVKGKKCLDVTKGLEMDLGGELISREDTSEMHEAVVEQSFTRKIRIGE